MQACPQERINRSRFAQCGFFGLYFITSDHKTCPNGESAIGVPGCPEFAFCTASADKTLTVSIHC